MTEKIPDYTHTAYFFIRTGIRKGKVFGYWKDGGKLRPESGGDYFARIDMLPRSGWDGRIQFVKFGDPVPGTEAPQRPVGIEGDQDDDDGEEA